MINDNNLFKNAGFSYYLWTMNDYFVLLSIWI